MQRLKTNQEFKPNSRLLSLHPFIDEDELDRLEDRLKNALTPGHFLVGALLHALHKEDFMNVKLNRLSRDESLTNIHQRFLKKWSAQYVTQLQQRGKWNKVYESEHLKLDAMVLLEETNTSPLSWKLDRGKTLLPGNDGLTLNQHQG